MRGVLNRFGSRILVLEDAVCEHQVKRGFGPLRHNLHFMCHGFQTEQKAGWCYNPCKQAWMVYRFLRAGYPDFAVGSFVWLVKPWFVFPFVLEDLRDRKKRKTKLKAASFFPSELVENERLIAAKRGARVKKPVRGDAVSNVSSKKGIGEAR